MRASPFSTPPARALACFMITPHAFSEYSTTAAKDLFSRLSLWLDGGTLDEAMLAEILRQHYAPVLHLVDDYEAARNSDAFTIRRQAAEISQLQSLRESLRDQLAASDQATEPAPVLELPPLETADSTLQR